jgi:hypothetical protein
VRCPDKKIKKFFLKNIEKRLTNKINYDIINISKNKRYVIMKEMLWFLAGLLSCMTIGFFGQWVQWSVIPYWKDKRKERKLKKQVKMLDKIQKI